MIDIIRVTARRLGDHIAGGGDAAEGFGLQAQDQPGCVCQLLPDCLGHRGNREVEGETVAERAANRSGSVIVNHYPYRPAL